MTPGDNCPECDRRLTSDTCKGCGWKVSAARPSTRICATCQVPSAEVREYDGRSLCLLCRHELMKARASGPDDVYAGRTVREMKAECAALLAKNEYKWGTQR